MGCGPSRARSVSTGYCFAVTEKSSGRQYSTRSVAVCGIAYMSYALTAAAAVAGAMLPALVVRAAMAVAMITGDGR